MPRKHESTKSHKKKKIFSGLLCLSGEKNLETRTEPPVGGELMSKANKSEIRKSQKRKGKFSDPLCLSALVAKDKSQ